MSVVVLLRIVLLLTSDGVSNGVYTSLLKVYCILLGGSTLTLLDTVDFLDKTFLADIKNFATLVTCADKALFWVVKNKLK